MPQTPRTFSTHAAVVWIAVLPLLLALGCAKQKDHAKIERSIDHYYSGNFERARKVLRPLADKTNEDFVLNNLRLGSSSLVDYNLGEAESAFLKAYEVMNSVGVNDGGRTAGAVLIDEKMKVWKGEPFERAMANFYLGLTYYIRAGQTSSQSDYNNARAAFENSLFKLRDYASEKRDKKGDYQEQESDFAIAYLMLGRCWQKLGRQDLAQANFAELARLRPDLAPLADPQRNADANVILVIDYGVGPRRVTDFDGAIVGFGPHPSKAGPVPPPTIFVDGQRVDLSGLDRPPTDLIALAQDRRWQSIDTIRTVKSALGTGLIAVGAYQGVKKNPDYGLAVGLIAAGALLKATSQADTREWEMLPRTTYILPLRIPPGTREIQVAFPGLVQTWGRLPVPEPGAGEVTYYFRPLRTGIQNAWVWPPAYFAPPAPPTQPGPTGAQPVPLPATP